MRFHWGHGIALYFTIFASLMLGFVYMSAQQDVNLVTENYYAEEIAFQDRIDRINNTRKLKKQVTFRREGAELYIQFPQGEVGGPISGNIQIFRPSDRFKDKQAVVKADQNGVQRLDLNTFTKGSYTIKVVWQADGQPFYSEYKIFI